MTVDKQNLPSSLIRVENLPSAEGSSAKAASVLNVVISQSFLEAVLTRDRSATVSYLTGLREESDARTREIDTLIEAMRSPAALPDFWGGVESDGGTVPPGPEDPPETADHPQDGSHPDDVGAGSGTAEERDSADELAYKVFLLISQEPRRLWSAADVAASLGYESSREMREVLCALHAQGRLDQVRRKDRRLFFRVPGTPA